MGSQHVTPNNLCTFKASKYIHVDQTYDGATFAVLFSNAVHKCKLISEIPKILKVKMLTTVGYRILDTWF